MRVHPTSLIISAGAEGCSRNYQGGKKKKVITADVAAAASLCDNDNGVVRLVQSSSHD